MSKVFAIRDDGLKFKELDLDMRDVRRQRPEHVPLDDILEFHLRNIPLHSWWVRPETDFISLTDESAPIPDISLWIYSTLVLSPKAYHLLRELLTVSGEFLPVQANGDTYYIYNCSVVVEVDEDKCLYDYEHENGTKMGVTHLEFLENASDNLVFKTPAESCVTLFCNEKFKDIVESSGLTGVIFDQNLIISQEKCV